MIDLIRRMMPDVTHYDVQHGSGRVRHLRLTGADGVARPCVLRRAPARELELYRTHLADPVTGAPALLGATPAAPAGAPGEVWLLLEGLPEEFPDYTNPDHVTRVYRHLAAFHTHFSGKVSATHLRADELARTIAPFAPAHAQKAHLLTEGPSTLIQGDYHRWNLLLTGGRVRVLDWELAACAPPIWDLLLLAPEEPGWDAVPRGAMAELALRTYHEAGPLARLSPDQFHYRQRLARLCTAARWCLLHQAKAQNLPAGDLRSQIESYAEAEAARIHALLSQL